MSLLTETDLIRWGVTAEMLLLFWSSAFVQGHLGQHVPAELRWLVRFLLSVVAFVALAVVVNALVGPDPTPGVYVAGVGTLPAALGTTWLAVRAFHRGRRSRQVLRQETAAFLAMVDGLDQADPCPDPTCIEARAELHDIATRLRAA